MKLKRFAKVCGFALRVTEHNGVLWATDQYWMTPLAGTVVEHYMQHWNLSGPGHYAWDGRRRLFRAADWEQPAKFAELADSTYSNELTPVTYDNEYALIIQSHPHADRRYPLTVWNHPSGAFTFLRRDYLDIVCPDWQGAVRSGDVVLYQGDENLKAVRVGAGIVMPVRPEAEPDGAP